MRRRSLWKQVLAVSLSVAMLVGLPAEAVFADGEMNEEVGVAVENESEAAELDFEFEENLNDDGKPDRTITITRYTGSDTEVAVPSQINGKTVTGIGYEAFSDCENLIRVTLPSEIKNIGYQAFDNCSDLEEINLPEGLTSIEDMTFSNCQKLRSIVIPSGVTSIGDEAFRRCVSLENITIPAGVTDIGDKVFSGCTGLSSINIEAGNIAYTGNGYNCIIDKNSNTLIAGCKNTVIPEGVTSIKEEAFIGCRGLTSIIFPDGLTNIGKNAFEDCSALVDITFPESMVVIGEAAFRGCAGLTSITIPENVTSIGEGAFSDCSGLASIEVKEANANYKSEKSNCIIERNSQTLITGCKNTIIPEGVTGIGDSAFSGCKGLKKIIIPQGVTSIGAGAFAWCTYLKSIVIPEGITEIKSGTFVNCGFTSFVIPDGTVRIESEAFDACDSLTRIKVPSSVTYIAEVAFELVDVDVTLYCAADSYARQYAIENNISYKELEEWEDLSCIHTDTEVRNVKSATCTETGYTGDTYCIDCGELISDGTAIAALGHAYTETITTQPTVTSEGVKTYTCSRCGDTYTETIAKLTCTHTNTEVRNAKSATCTETGYTGDTYCVDCGILISNGTATAASGHSYVESITTQPTVTSEGVKTYTCSRCGNTYTETIAKLTVTYTVKFNGNGATGGSMANQGITYGVTTVLTANGFQRKGYTFKNWNTSKDGSGAAYDDKADASRLTETNGAEITLYAQWTANKYIITFNGNGSTSGSTKKLSNCKYGKKYTLTKNGFKKTGYTFNGWNTKKDGSGKTYKNKAEVKNLSSKADGKVTLYAQWKETKYTITYNLNKGKNNKNNPSSYNVTTKTIKLKNPTRKGYTFKGWYSDKKCTKKVTQVKKGSTGNITLYAKWTKK